MKSGIKKYEVKTKSILKLEFFNPQKNNALSLSMLDEIISILSNKKYLNSFKCVTFSGANKGAYSSGADLDDIKKLIKKNKLNLYHAKINKIINLLDKINIPVFSFVKSYCYGAGFILALQSDIIIAENKAKFCIPATKLNIKIPKKQINSIKKKINVIFLKDILLSSKVFSAKEAYHFGIINYILETRNYKVKIEELLDRFYSIEKKVLSYYLASLKKN